MGWSDKLGGFLSLSLCNLARFYYLHVSHKVKTLSFYLNMKIVLRNIVFINTDNKQLTGKGMSACGTGISD